MTNLFNMDNPFSTDAQPQQPQQSPFQPQMQQSPFQSQSQPQQMQQSPFQSQPQQMQSPFQQPFQPEIPQGTIQNQGLPQPDMFQQPTMTPFQTGVEIHQQPDQPEKQQYHIIDLFWLINRKLIYGQALDPSESHILTIGFNASFNNLRCTLLSANQNAITQTSIVIQNATRLSGFNIYSEEALLLKAYQNSGTPIIIRERQFKAGNTWSPNITKIIWNKESIVINTVDSSNKVCNFILVQDQIAGFEKALDFMLNGMAWILGMMGVLKKS